MIVLTRAIKTLYYFSQIAISFQTEKRTSTYAKLLYAIEDLGGIYIKFMQFLCLRGELFSNEEKIKFVRLFDQVIAEPLDIEQVLQEQLGKKRKEIHSVESTPFASGSFAQVYKAQLADNTVVIIKVKKNNLKTKIWFDFLLLNVVVRIVTLLFEIEQLDLHQLIKEFKQTTFQELDYLTEVSHAQYLYQQYRDSKVVVIPKTFADLSTQSIIVQEFVDGVPMTDVITWKESNPEYYELFKQQYGIKMRELIVTIVKELVIQHLTFDQFYGDPHPGNIIILPNNKFAFIDFGILDQAVDNRKGYFEMLKSLSVPIGELDAEQMSTQVLKLGAFSLYQALSTLERISSSSGRLTQVVIREYTRLITERKEYLQTEEEKKREDMTATILCFTKVGKKFQIQVPKGFFNVMRSSAMFKSYASFLEPDYHFMRSVYRDIIAEYEDVILKDTGQPVVPYSLEESFEVVSTWLGGLAEVDIPLYLQIHSVLNQIDYAQ